MALGGAFGALMAHDALSCGNQTDISAHQAAVRLGSERSGNVRSPDEGLALLVAVVFELGLTWKVPPSAAAERLALEIAQTA